MKKIRLKVKTESPLLIKANNDESNLVETMEYIPGSQIWGKLAQYFLADDFYEEIFLSGDVKFNNLYKSASKPVPLSAFSCKYYDGFAGDSGEKHGVYDLLLDRVRLYQNQINREGISSHCTKEIKQNDKVLGSRIQGKSCDSVLKSFSGFYTKKDNNYQEVTIDKKRIEKTALNTKNQTAKEGSLYVLETINSGQEFSGLIEINNDKQEISDKLIELLKDLDSEYFGSAKTRGHGKVSLDFEVVDASWDSLRAKQEQRFEKIKQSFAKTKDNNYFILTLDAAAILYDRFLQGKKYIEISDICNSVYLSEAEAEELKKFSLLTKVDEADNKLFFANSDSVYGWNSVMRLPKPIQPALTKGSVFIYETKEEIDKAVLLDALTKVELQGVGAKRNQGYGSLTINDRFHYDKAKKG